MTVIWPSPATAVGVPGVPGVAPEICAVKSEVPVVELVTLLTVLDPITTDLTYSPTSSAPSEYVDDVAPDIVVQLNGEVADVQRCHV